MIERIVRQLAEPLRVIEYVPKKNRNKTVNKRRRQYDTGHNLVLNFPIPDIRPV